MCKMKREDNVEVEFITERIELSIWSFPEPGGGLNMCAEEAQQE